MTLIAATDNAPPTHEIALRTNGSLEKHHKPHADTAEYQRMYKKSIEHPAQFWDEVSFHTLLQRIPFRAGELGVTEGEDEIKLCRKDVERFFCAGLGKLGFEEELCLSKERQMELKILVERACQACRCYRQIWTSGACWNSGVLSGSRKAQLID